MRQVAWGVRRPLVVILGLWVAFQSLSGVVLLFGDSIEHWRQPELTRYGPGDRGAAEALAVVRQNYPGEEVGVLDVKVRKVVHADIKALQNWQLDAAGRTSSLYYVMMTVANVGDEDLSGQRIPLYVLDGANALVESSAFKKEFKPCPSPALADGFVTGEKVTVCQAYLVPKRGEVDAVTFRPTEKFNPINWVGKVTEPQEPAKSRSAG